MSKIAWLVQRDGLMKVDVLESTCRHQRLKVLEGEKEGQEMVIGPEGNPNGRFFPSLYIGDEPPELFRFKGRSLQVLDHGDSDALIPDSEPYRFQPWTERLIDAVHAGDHVLIAGHKGTGKTSAVMQLAARTNKPVIRVNLNGQVSVSDLIGSVGFSDGGTTWNDGPVITAMKNGLWLLLDEFDFADPSVMSIFHSILERKPAYCLKENGGEVVTAHPNFRVFATCNSLVGDDDGMYAGTQAINAALLDRFSGHGQVIQVPAMPEKEERQVLLAAVPQLSKSLAKRLSDLATRLRSQHLPHFSSRELINFARKLVMYRNAGLAAETTFLGVVRDDSTREAIGHFVKDQFPRRIVLSRGAAGKRQGASSQPAPSPGGRTSSQVTDPVEIDAMLQAKADGKSYQEIERQFGLRDARGMNAYRIIQKHQGMASDNANKETTDE